MAKILLMAGATSLSVGGQEYLPDEEGCVVIDDAFIPDATRAGHTVAGVEQPPAPEPPTPAPSVEELKAALDESERLRGELAKANDAKVAAEKRVTELEAELADARKDAKKK